MFRTHFSPRRGVALPVLLALLTAALLPARGGDFVRASALAADAPSAARTSHGVTTIGLYDLGASTFHLRNSNTQGTGDMMVQYGPSPGSRTCGAPPPYFCTTGWLPVVGDWDGNGTDTIGLYHQPTGTFFLKNSDTAGAADLTFSYGVGGSGWLPLTGDWDGDGIDTVGVYDPNTAFFFLKNSNAAGPADSAFQYGPGGVDWLPMVGDWDGNGLDTVGLYNPNITTYFLKNTNLSGPADFQFTWAPTAAGNTGFPLAGDWDANATDTVGLYDPNISQVFLKNSNAAGPTDITFGYGPTSAITRFVPVAGDWDGL